MKRMIIVPDGWPCMYSDCPPGFFVLGEFLYLKSEYGDDGYCDTGEAFAAKDSLVQPVIAKWEEYDD